MASKPTPTPSDPSTTGNGTSPPPTLPELLEEAERVRGLLQEALTRLARVVAALKQQRRQGRAVAAALASLQQLPWQP